MTPQQRYKKKAIIRFTIEINRNTENDILQWLERQANKAGAVKNTIREHIRFAENDPPGIVPQFGDPEE